MFVTRYNGSRYWITGTPSKDERSFMFATLLSDKELRKGNYIAAAVFASLYLVILGTAGFTLISGSMAFGYHVPWLIAVLVCSCITVVYVVYCCLFFKRGNDNYHRKLEFRQRNRAISCNYGSYDTFTTLLGLCGGNLLLRRKKDVDEFLLDSDTRRIDDLLHGKDLSQKQRDALKDAAKERVKQFIKQLNLLDQPYQEEMTAKRAIEKEIEDAKELDEELARKARRKVADEEAAWFIRQFSNES